VLQIRSESEESTFEAQNGFFVLFCHQKRTGCNKLAFTDSYLPVVKLNTSSKELKNQVLLDFELARIRQARQSELLRSRMVEENVRTVFVSNTSSGLAARSYCAENAIYTR
jgi:hypothetical protein